jgi:hypothetical protein
LALAARRLVSRFWRARIGLGRAKFRLFQAKFELFRDISGVFSSQMGRETAIFGWKRGLVDMRRKGGK